MRVNRFDYTSIKAKLIFAYILLAIIPIFIITVSANIIYSRIIQSNLDTLLDYSMNQAGKLISDNIKEYESIFYNIVFDKDILYYSQKIQENKDVPISKYFMTKRLISYANSSEEIRSVLFISNSLDYALYEKSNFITHESYFYDKDVRENFLDLSRSEEGITLISTSNLKARYGDDLYLFFLAIPVKDYITQKQYGSLFIGIRESTLSTLTSKGQNLNDDIYKMLSSKNIIVDKNNKIISHQEKAYIGKKLSTFMKNEINNNILIKRKGIPDTPWELVNIINKDDIYNNVRNYEIIVVLISIIITLIFLAIIITITKHYSKSIRQIANGIRSFGKGQRDITFEFEEKDELFDIAYQFNKMARRINNLVDTLEKQKRNIEIVVNKKRKSELKALESQINPHFIYNTLDMINWTAIDNNQEEISEMLSTLGSLLRYSISNIDIMVKLKVELQWIKKYIYLQKIRYNNSFECIYDISKEALEFPIYKLLLQPAIENAIQHGFAGIKSGGIIKITAFVNNSNILCIEIADNGHGIKRDLLVQLHEYINNDSLFDGEDMGVKNIINRVKLYYLGEAQINIESIEGEGTKIKITLPHKNI